jgi:bifunctional non-homologous end joining protein LigD
MRKVAFEPCIPTCGTRVPAGPDCLHEIKHDGYRLIVRREGKRVRLFTRNGHDWTDRFPLIVEAALQLRKTSFVIDGEAVVVVGPDGISDFDALHGGKRDADVRLYAGSEHRAANIKPSNQWLRQIGPEGVGRT